MAAAAALPVVSLLPEPHRRFTVDQVLRMVDVGILGEEDRVELVQGELLEVTPQGPDRRGLKDELHARLIGAYGGREVHVLNQGPMRAGPVGLPEPDLAVIRGNARQYLSRHPTAGDALLVIEIAKTSQGRDRSKAADYARGGAPAYWLVDIDGRTVSVYTEPDRDRGLYRSITALLETDEIALPELDVRWKVATLLP